ncbi:glucose-1-phosphate cytidylyltransferase [Crocinitomicaceae bacterium CZZ-1]|uniref:Glucose-1-phosphate cytidylyltransferase n=1 Tax=Taishania pollutisoli TaxID=2766479 RepID=A0A8J6P4Z9_9FLAO|nr:glucose-1-phosphate cytidylyltransferase [Taishania pollutisoli]MBC9811794.1 glucose-1-phosphate cytidylyltransferase [Taishania pollutisoli]MBX2948271.1 glucose-1-phosphate cytidylyltransferase [Crocinitomicaceae bacterium]NGF75369.1 glucose-1-phosphate cytidylyltransferase [Fluviicola sp. SGL-29]
MKVVILAGGLGTRLMEETEARPKPMVEIGGKPILWHIMKIYAHYGFNEFILCLGYKQSSIKEYFINYYLYNADITVDLKNNDVEVHLPTDETFKVTLIDTGLETNTAGRIKRIKKYVGEETFMLTYGDGVSNVNLTELLTFHRKSGKMATLTSVQMPGKFGNICIDANSEVKEFIEKPTGDGMWINGGFFVMEPGVFEFLEGDMDEVQFEKGPLVELAKTNNLAAYKHEGFWKCMDALRDRIELEKLWHSGNAEWKIWK